MCLSPGLCPGTLEFWIYDIARQVRSTASRVFFDLQSAYCARQVRGCCGIRYRAARLRCTCSTAILTCSLLISFVFYKETAFCLYRLFFIRNQRLALVACFGFFNEEYLIALVDFIAPCGGTKEWGRRDLRIPPSPRNHACVVRWTPPFPTLGNRCGGLIRLPRAYTNLGFLCPVQTVYPHFDFLIGCFVSGLGLFTFQLVLFGLYRSFFIIGWKKDAVCLAFTHVF